MERDADLVLEGRPTPPVVVAPYERDGNPTVHDPRQRAQNPGVTARDDMTVLEPEIEQVPVDDQLARVRRGVLQPLDELVLPFTGDHTEVDITGEVDGTGRHGAGRYTEQ